MGLIMAPTTDRIRTTATILGRHSIGTAGIDITVTTVIITTVIGNKLTQNRKNPSSWLESDLEPALFTCKHLTGVDCGKTVCAQAARLLPGFW
jgi:hypothetical protein